MRHLAVARFLLVLLACGLGCSCATARGTSAAEEEDSLELFLDSGASSLVCDETRLVGATSFSPTCLPTEESSRVTTTGLESLAEPLRECVLTSLPVETGNADPTACQRGAAQVLHGRLRQLGWLDATVSPPPRTPAPHTASLSVQLGVRYQVGPLFVEPDADARVAPERILTKARAAAPEGSWYTSSVLAAMHSRVFQMRKFRAVWVVGGEPDPERRLVPVTIDVWEKPSKPGKKDKPPKLSKQKRPDHCPKRGSICLNGRDCTFDHGLGCTVCSCRPGRW
ncbi:hypothetical protein [Hyalangium rubrum]|uniref:C3H1-type domain-containing protein n=1 Tax=Hyalangium rubrum TaxID=3103134 RepID=A0ABU5GY14_9BACT|nr:hypothetical protein [Hyalangium sp. s54d21]MDY7226088.1 hypothetical protein [Hyalangium sp. s54d21]